MLIWTTIRGRKTREVDYVWAVPDLLEASTWRDCREQVRALRRYGLLCFEQGRLVTTVHGRLILDMRYADAA